MTLETDVHEETSKAIIIALQQIKGVISVEPVVAGADMHIAREQVRQELRKQLWDVLYGSPARR